jgi:hypothetical protein
MKKLASGRQRLFVPVKECDCSIILQSPVYSSNMYKRRNIVVALELDKFGT